ncbi:P-loop containing nucleoside triphosphate hydrolase protein [Tuber magnatum]|uniref:P-loop containing nucleoside triphosphate hydrolase protein n=1 Tax=Tuber magnatum TaxID=42249 RepID=A0A317SU38_9PEZI|nr:P-loop containing nucleoside triphosphate hydrolase protein [Tuber magnatum]
MAPALPTATSASTRAPAKPPPAQPPRRKRKNRTPVITRLIVDDLRGEVAYVSEDIWRDVFGFVKQEPKPKPEQETVNGIPVMGGPAMVIVDDDEDDEPIPPTLHVAVTSLISSRETATKKWTIFPVTFLPGSSQFPGLPPATMMLPRTIALPPSLAAAGEKSSKPFGVLLIDVVPVGLERVFVNVRFPVGTPVEDDQDLEDRVKEALGSAKLIRTGDDLPLRYAHGRIERGKARIELCEPVEQGLLLRETKVVVVKEKLSNTRRRGPDNIDGIILDGECGDGGGVSLSGEDGATGSDDDEDDPLAFSGFLSTPLTSSSLSFPSISTTPHLRNGYHSPNTLASPAPTSTSKEFTTQPLTRPIPSGLLHPKPKEQDDDEARAFVKVGDLAKLGCFSGDWVRIHLPAPPPTDTASRDLSAMRGDTGSDLEVGRPVKIYSLPEGWETSGLSAKRRRVSGKGKELAVDGDSKKELNPIVYLSPVLLANLASPPTTIVSEVVLSPFPTAPTSLLSPAPLFPPAAKEVTLLRIASPISTDRALQPSLLLQLKSYFESCRRLVRKGDVIAVGIDEALARSLYGGDGADGVTEELLTGGVEEKGSRRTCVAWFRVGSIGPSEEAPEKSPVGRRMPDKKDKEDDSIWGGVVFVDPASTRMVQAGSERRKIPPTISSTWEYYLELHPPPLRLAAVQGVPPALITPGRYVNRIQRRLRELVSAATSQRAVQLGLQSIAILLTSTQRSIGKRTLAMRAAADVGVHVFHIDAYDIISDGGAGDAKTEGFLRARVDRALSCGKESCVLLLSHIEALTAARMGEVLKDIVGQMRIVIATTTEVDKLSENIRNVFTHEMEVGAPDENERVGLLEGIVDERRVRLGNEVDLGIIAVKTAALVAGDLVDVVERAVAASQDRILKLAKKCRARQKDPNSPEGPVSVKDLEIAGGDETTSVLKCDFEVAVDAARKNFSDSIGAPKIPNVGWDDVGGLANVKSAVMETIQLPLERPELFAKGMKKRSGILFYGPPGTGKTLLAKAIATEFSLNFFSIKGPELLNMYIGESEANLLAELDGMSEGTEGSGGVFVIGATNRPDLLDAALLRPGRFDKMLYLGVSDTHDKQLTIMEALTRKFTLSPTLSLRSISETLPFTYTGADLYALCSDAMLKAITRQANLVDEKIKRLSATLEEPVSTAHFFDSIARPEDVLVVVGEEDFLQAKSELVGSVSAKELEHYQRVREQFEMAEEKEKKQGKGKAIEQAVVEEEEEAPVVDGKGGGKVVMVDRDAGVEVEDIGLQLRSRLEIVPEEQEWEDGAEGDEQDLYGSGA